MAGIGAFLCGFAALRELFKSDCLKRPESPHAKTQRAQSRNINGRHRRLSLRLCGFAALRELFKSDCLKRPESPHAKTQRAQSRNINGRHRRLSLRLCGFA
ncbi:MAG: hypothetical protein V9H69_07295 [Anaerolineae bacterium]